MSSGLTGKDRHNHHAGSNYMCLPLDPEFSPSSQEGFQSNARMYGVEYEAGGPLIDGSLNNQDTPCAVCDVDGRSRVLMIPAKLSCPTDWTKEYVGVLMAQNHGQSASEYICVSDGMEIVAGGEGNDDGGLLYVVEAVCGSLPCPPYVEGYEIVCVVCTK